MAMDGIANSITFAIHFGGGSTSAGSAGSGTKTVKHGRYHTLVPSLSIIVYHVEIHTAWRLLLRIGVHGELLEWADRRIGTIHIREGN